MGARLLDIFVVCQCCRFLLKFLYVVLAKIVLPDCQCRMDVLEWLRLAHCDEHGLHGLEDTFSTLLELATQGWQTLGYWEHLVTTSSCALRRNPVVHRGDVRCHHFADLRLLLCRHGAGRCCRGERGVGHGSAPYACATNCRPAHSCYTAATPTTAEERGEWRRHGATMRTMSTYRECLCA